VQTNQGCPECGVSINTEEIGKDVTADKIIQDLDILCMNHDCDWKGKFEKLPKHIEICPFGKQPHWLQSKSQESEHLTVYIFLTND
jgi:hypothetical protein